MDTGKSSIFACSYNMMKPSPSELALEELLKNTKGSEVVFENDNNAHHFAFENDGRSFRDISPPIDQDIMNGFSDTDVATMWSHSLTPKSSTITVTSDCQSSIYVGSPTSISPTKTQAGNQANSGSSHDQSDDDDDNGTEAGSCDQSTNPFDIKRIKRKESNRESARRSRKRKQAHLAELEQQVEELRGESSSLFKQLTNSMQQLKDATTNNRVLKSDVEALRAKVKLAEDMVARGSLTSDLSHLLQDYLNITLPQTIQNNHMSSTISNVNGHGTTAYSGASFGLENIDPFNNIKNNGVMRGDAVSSVSCVSELRPWESHVVSISK